jgi:hypothetical protein
MEPGWRDGDAAKWEEVDGEGETGMKRWVTAPGVFSHKEIDWI